MGPARGYHPIPVTGRHITLPLFERESTAFRFPAILFAGLLIAMVYLFARRFVPWPAAAAAAVLALAQPHYFFHAPIACFDAPITTMAFAVGFAYWKSLRSPRWGHRLRRGLRHRARRQAQRLADADLPGRALPVDAARRSRAPPAPPRIPLAFVSMAMLGPIIFFLHWPWLWHGAVARTRSFTSTATCSTSTTTSSTSARTGTTRRPRPRDKLLRATFPFVSTGLTVPVTTLALALWGGAVLWRRRRGAPVLEDGPAEAPPRIGAAQLAAPRRRRRPRAGAFLAVQIFGPLACWPCRRRRSSAA